MSYEKAFDFEANEEFVELCFPDGYGSQAVSSICFSRADSSIIVPYPKVKCYGTGTGVRTKDGTYICDQIDVYAESGL